MKLWVLRHGEAEPRAKTDAERRLTAHGREQVLLVSHQPLVGTLVGALEHGDRQQPAAMSTASLAELEGEWPLAGLMTLRAIHSPA